MATDFHGLAPMRFGLGKSSNGAGDLVQLEAKGLGELSLVEVEGVESVHAEFEGCGDVEQVGGTGA